MTHWSKRAEVTKHTGYYERLARRFMYGNRRPDKKIMLNRVKLIVFIEVPVLLVLVTVRLSKTIFYRYKKQ
jgi:hypothetical protein